MDDCITSYIRLAKEVFKKDQVLKGIIPLGDNQCRFNYRDLEDAIKRIVRDHLNDENAPIRDATNSKCPTFVVATPALNADGPPKLFRSYQCRGHNSDTCTIWEAGRATSAAPSFFKPVYINSPPPSRIFIDGGLAHNNPSELALSEAERIWPDVRRFCLVSIGTGRQKSVKFIEKSIAETEEPPLERTLSAIASRIWGALPGSETASRAPAGITALMKIGQACVQLATSLENVHQRVFKRAISGDPSRQFPYHRFNVERDMDDIGLEEWERMDEMGEHTARYMEEGEGEWKRDKCVEDLMAFTASGRERQPQGQRSQGVRTVRPWYFLCNYVLYTIRVIYLTAVANASEGTPHSILQFL